MKRLLALAIVGAFAAVATPAFAENAQQERMKTCNTKAADKKGDERKAFMQTCLSNKPMTQQEKIAACNRQATGKTGSERKAFMKSCLRNKS